MKRIHPHSIGLVLAIFVALWHALWAVLVWAGGAQAVIDFIFRLHMITPPYQIAAFSLGTAAGLVFVTAAAGYIFGWVMGVIWNTYGPVSVNNLK